MSTLLVRALLVTLLALAGGSARASQQACYLDISSYMLETFGQSYQGDENLLVKEQRYGNQIFTMVADLTPGTNIVRTLFRKTAKDGYCMVLQTLPAAELKVARTDKAGTPLEFRTIDQAPGTQPGNELIYSLGKANTYIPTRCRELTYEGKRVIKKRVPCPPSHH